MAIDFTTLLERPVYSAFEYLSMLKRLLPRGPIWGFNHHFSAELLQDIVPPGDEIQDIVPPGDEIQDIVYDSTEISSSLLGRFLSVVGEELARLEARAYTLLQETTPGVAIELLPEWEKEAGLPDSCTSTLTLTEAERQAHAHAKLFNENGTTTDQFFIDYAAVLGFTIEIDSGGTNTEPFIMGVARTGRSRFGSKGARSVSTFTVIAGDGNLDQLKCIFKKLKPAHVIIVWVDER